MSEVYQLVSEKIISWYEVAIKSIPNLAAAFFTILAFIFLARIAKRLSSKFLPKVTKSKSVTSLLETIVYLLVVIAGVFIALGILKLDKTVTSLLAGAGVIGLAVGFAFQEIASNFFSGVLIAFTEPYQLGDIVQVGDFTGEVIKIQLRTTSIMTFQGLEVLIPNKDMFTKPFTNFTTTPQRRIDLVIGVSYRDNLRKVKDVVLNTLESIKEKIPNKDVKVYYSEFGDSSINFTVQLWVQYPGHQSYLEARSESIMRIKEAFDRKELQFHSLFAH